MSLKVLYNVRFLGKIRYSTNIVLWQSHILFLLGREFAMDEVPPLPYMGMICDVLVVCFKA